MEKKDAFQEMADRLGIAEPDLRKVLRATVAGKIKVDQSDTYREINEEELSAFVSVANTYGLNPLIKEIYPIKAFKGGQVLPVISTDGWNKILTTHPDYVSHWYEVSEVEKTMLKAKPCFVWCEIHIKKTNGEVVIIREYLDECFRELNYINAWQTHTKRFMRHKTKIQGVREAFGFCGVYDRDEAERIIEGKEAELEFKEPLQEPQPLRLPEEKQPQIAPILNEPQKPATKPPEPSPEPKPKTAEGQSEPKTAYATPQLKAIGERIHANYKETGVSDEDYRLYLEQKYGVKSSTGILSTDTLKEIMVFFAPKTFNKTEFEAIISQKKIPEDTFATQKEILALVATDTERWEYQVKAKLLSDYGNKIKVEMDLHNRLGVLSENEAKEVQGWLEGLIEGVVSC